MYCKIERHRPHHLRVCTHTRVYGCRSSPSLVNYASRYTGGVPIQEMYAIFWWGCEGDDVLRKFGMVYMVGILVIIIPICKVVFTLITLLTLLKCILKNYYSRDTPPNPTTPTVPILWGSAFVINTGQSSAYGQFLRRQRSEHQLSSSWSATLGHLGQRIEECILPPHPLQVCCCAESWKGCRHAAQLPSSAKNLIFFFVTRVPLIFFDHSHPRLATHTRCDLPKRVCVKVKSNMSGRGGGSQSV